ncbi:MAG: hydrogenase 3 maturation endopeptidase HyCI [Candidatus Omnitrophota bacterium]|jgi:hydrogenase maturation protease HycI|nr:hydrogenase 3 maturation endopeptidase HyCI [Candidatus Omnitrophota bacterium]
MLTLKDTLKGKVIVLCLGNLDRGDDGVGPYIAAQIKDKVPYKIIDAGVTPENYTGVIRRLDPDTIVIIDAVQFEGKPGDVKIFLSDELRSGKISTHDVSPKLLIEYLTSSMKAKIYILGIKPKTNKIGEGLSKEALSAVEKIEKMFVSDAKNVDKAKGI